MAYTARSPLHDSRYQQRGSAVLSKRVKLTLTLLMLVLSAALASLCADKLVSAVEHVLANTPLTEAFLGLVLFPLLGNTTELGTAVSVAMSNQIDLAINVSIGSAAQIALFMAPILVIIAWISHNSLSLVFHTFETSILILAIAAVTSIMSLGSGHYSGGVVLVAIYTFLWSVFCVPYC